MTQQDLIRHYEAQASRREDYRRRNWYYYALLERQYCYFIPPNRSVLEVGCSTGHLLAAVHPSRGVGIDISPSMIARARGLYPKFCFHAGTIADYPEDETFDYIILSGLVGDLDDIQGFLKKLRRFCTPDTRIIIEYYSYLWQSLARVAEWTGCKMPQPEQNWLTRDDIVNFLNLSDYEAVARERAILVPFRFFGISGLVNTFLAKFPIFNALTLNHFIVARPLPDNSDDAAVTIVVPCRNERGNIESVVRRTPVFGTHQEFIFVEGHSSDGTREEVERVIRAYPQKDIKLFIQAGEGKRDAVRLGFSRARGDILMILDADLTVQPEDMPKFYDAIRSGKGEFINGCRLVYPLEDEAMRFLNLVANKFFGLFFSWLLGHRFKDTLCGTKVISRRHYAALDASRDYFGDFDPFGDFDLIFGAVKLNLKVVEIPVAYKRRQYGSTQIERFRHGLLLLRMCWFAMKKIKFIS